MRFDLRVQDPAMIPFLFGLKARVTRKPYASYGFALMALKLGVDAIILHGATGRWWNPWEFLSLATVSSQVPTWAIRALMFWALPFAWIALTMTVRRSIDAGYSPWVGLLVCVPLLNFAVMLLFCLLPPRPLRVFYVPAPDAPPHAELRAVAYSLVVAMVMAGVSVLAIRDFSSALFAGTPFAMGVVAGYRLNRDVARSVRKTMLLSLACIAVAAAMVMLFAFEGLLCVAMALPLAIPLVAMGALLGRAVATRRLALASPLALILLVLPAAAWVEPTLRTDRQHMVTSQVHINAPPREVWRHLIAFTPIPPPNELYFRLGIAYPVRARIVGQGVGAIRYCDFSTGAFVEPITKWVEPRLLSFDVADQPDPLRELSPYPRVYVNHLNGSIASKRGQFRLTPSPDGGTVLEGTTWYEISMFPLSYWTAWTDYFIRSIHLRVLRHIKTDTESAL